MKTIRMRDRKWKKTMTLSWRRKFEVSGGESIKSIKQALWSFKRLRRLTRTKPSSSLVISCIGVIKVKKKSKSRGKTYPRNKLGIYFGFWPGTSFSGEAPLFLAVLCFLISINMRCTKGDGCFLLGSVSWIDPPFFFFNKDCKTVWKNIISV